MSKYFFFLVLGPVSNVLWAWWALPEINEQGTTLEMFQWIATQAALPVLFGILLALGSKIARWFILVYSGFTLLFAIGIFGWALMGSATPVSIYVVAGILFVMGFGLLYQSMKDLNFGHKERKTYAENQ